MREPAPARTAFLLCFGGRFRARGLLALAMLALCPAACGGREERAAPNAGADAQTAAPVVEETAPEDARARNARLLAEAVAGPWRSPEERARDRWRRPGETLAFFGLEPDMTVVEAWPGGGWYTNIIAPYLKAGGGVYIAAGFDPARSAEAAAASARFSRAFADRPDVYGTVRVSVLGGASPLASPGEADMALTFRNVHNWLDQGVAPGVFAAFYEALTPGGVLGVVEHRAAPEAGDGESHGGYVTEKTVIGLAEAAGFVLEEASDVNANPADDRDHPFGVWTLPPVRRSAPAPGTEAPGFPSGFPRGKYDAIGESDRMTLRFRKPGGDGAAVETSTEDMMDEIVDE